MQSVRIGSVVHEALGRDGIVVREEGKPSDSWLAEQADEEMRNQPISMRWWAVMPLTGGLVLLPESKLHVLREATYQDFLTAVDHAGIDGRQSLAAIFPEFRDRVVASARRPGGGA